MHQRTSPPPRAVLAVLVLLALLVVPALAGCSLSSPDQTAAGPRGTVVVATHDSWALPKQVLADFEQRTGYHVRTEPTGDAGELTNRLVLTAGSPQADAVYGLDNTFASKAVDAGVLAPYAPRAEAPTVQRFEPDDAREAARLTPVDYGDVCFNVDDTWFREHDLAPPRTMADLTEPAYRDLVVVPSPATSSPGLAFLLATIDEYGTGPQGWTVYWQRLLDNGTQVASGWTDAYTVDFTAGGGDGDRPVVLSYASSPPFTVPEGGTEPSTSSLLRTCYRQVEYAGVLAGAENSAGARAFVDFMLSPPVQEALPESMYVFPADTDTALPPDWERFADVAPHPYSLPPAQVEAHREQWLRQWEDLATS